LATPPEVSARVDSAYADGGPFRCADASPAAFDYWAAHEKIISIYTSRESVVLWALIIDSVENLSNAEPIANRIEGGF
jgi:hypothetical protein